MQFLSSATTTPLVPANKSGIIINIDIIASPVQLTLPSAFQAGLYPFSSLIIFEQTETPIISTFEIILPQANLMASFNGTMIANQTSIAVVVKDFTGNELYVIEPGFLFALYLTDNSTEEGTWLLENVGSGVSAVNASELAGNGLIARGTTLNVFTDVVQFTNPITIDESYGYSMLEFIGGIETQQLPVPPYAGFSLYIKNLSPSNGILTVEATPSGLALIDGSATVSLAYNQGIYVTSDGTNWFTIGLNNLNTDSVQLTAQGIRVIDGSESEPSYSFINFPSTGLYTTAGNVVAVTVNSSQIGEFNSNGLNIIGTVSENGIPISLISGLYP